MAPYAIMKPPVLVPPTTSHRSYWQPTHWIPVKYPFSTSAHPLGAKGVDTVRVEEACKQLGYNFSLAPKGAVNAQEGRIDVLLDEGDFGWEPTLYILAHNPLDLIDRTHQVLSAIEGMK